LDGLVGVGGRIRRARRIAMYYWLIIALLIALIGTLYTIRQRQAN
jgi:hypothetical protein